MTPAELRTLSIHELRQYLDALLDLPRPVSDEAQVNFRSALRVLRHKYDLECAAAAGLSLTELYEFRDALEAWFWATQRQR
jgi:hypothetical protein